MIPGPAARDPAPSPVALHAMRQPDGVHIFAASDHPIAPVEVPTTWVETRRLRSMKSLSSGAISSPARSIRPGPMRTS